MDFMRMAATGRVFINTKKIKNDPIQEFIVEGNNNQVIAFCPKLWDVYHAIRDDRDYREAEGQLPLCYYVTAVCKDPFTTYHYIGYQLRWNEEHQRPYLESMGYGIRRTYK